MTLSDQENGVGGEIMGLNPASDRSKQKRRRTVCIWCCLVKWVVITPAIIILIFTIFTVKPPDIQLISIKVEGMSPRVYFPAIKVELNITLNLTLFVHNPNHVGFKAGYGVAHLVYKGNRLGDGRLDPSLVPSRGSVTLVSVLTLKADRFVDFGLLSLVKDIMDGKLALQIETRIPGRAKILVFRKHVVVTYDCLIVIGFPDVKIISQNCKQHTKL